ncbi:trafficking protein particle complex subunit 12 [Microplitis demolitor]|uniref:trafficking protein particle complex subunit 12 n=1 Tax=Microplitis demolitor TaxID=69319 RepID=UPI0004CD1FFB|nr:trafficking protein particle complex subunit 12 [Microplitis demolitor]
MTEESNQISDNNLGRYFDSSHTIFDEIVSSNVLPGATSTPASSMLSLVNTELLPASDLFKQNDLFNNERSIESSAVDYHRDAWIPCDKTRKILRTIAASGNNNHDRENLTMPGLTLQNDMSDPIKDTTIHYLGIDEIIHRNISTASDVTQDERGLRNLIQSECYRAAVNLTGRLLAIYGQGYGKINYPSKHTPHSLQLWYTRLALLAKLRQVDVLKAESQPFGNLDKPDMYFIYYPELYGTRHGSMASFAFRLLLAELPNYWGDSKEAIDNLYKLLATIDQILKNLNDGLAEEGGHAKFSDNERNDSIRLWTGRKSRVLISIVNCSLSIKNFSLAIDVLEDLCAMPSWTTEQLEILKSACGRVYLFLGDVTAAEKIFAGIKEARDGTSGNGKSPTMRELIDRGLMAVAQNSFQDAYNCFKIASASDPSNVMLINNMAVCLLYSGQLKSAVQLLETAVMRNPIKSLQETVLLNISTLYELHTTHCKQSKLQLLRQMNRYKGDATDISCLKLA